MDRNDVIRPAIDVFLASLSARRAWIEILLCRQGCRLGAVALRKESVDRNTQRRDFKRLGLVALRKESVDRNNIESASFRACICRSPQGERG